MKQDEQLKPCPFCGQQPYIGYLYTKDMQAVTCKNPDCTQSESFSVAEWNTRPGEDALHAEIDRLRAAANRLCATLRIWHDNGGFEASSWEHAALETVLGSKEMIGGDA